MNHFSFNNSVTINRDRLLSHLLTFLSKLAAMAKVTKEVTHLAAAGCTLTR